MNIVEKSQLCRAILTGGIERNRAIETLYSDGMIRKAIEGIVFRYQGNKEDARDIFQEAIILFDRNVRENKFDHASKDSTYIISLGKYLWLNRMRKTERIDYTEDDVALDQVQDSNPETDIIHKEVLRELNQMLRQSGEKCYRLLRLWKESIPLIKLVEELNYPSYNAIRKQKYRCIQKLTDMVKSNNRLLEFFKQ